MRRESAPGGKYRKTCSLLFMEIFHVNPVLQMLDLNITNIQSQCIHKGQGHGPWRSALAPPPPTHTFVSQLPGEQVRKESGDVFLYTSLPLQGGMGGNQGSYAFLPSWLAAMEGSTGPFVLEG